VTLAKVALPAAAAATVALGAAPAAVAATSSHRDDTTPAKSRANATRSRTRAMLRDTPDMGVSPLTAHRTVEFPDDSGSLTFTIKGTSNYVSDFEGSICMGSLKGFTGHVQITGPSGFSISTLGHMVVSSDTCGTKTRAWDQYVPIGRYYATAWRNDGGGKYTDEGRTYINVG